MSGARTIPVTFYTKPGCHLCEAVEDQLDVLAERWPLVVTALNITADLDLHRRYWDKIPVVVIGDAMLQAPITPSGLAQAVAQALERKQ